MRSVSIVSSHAFREGEVQAVMSQVGARYDNDIWRLIRNNRMVMVQIGNEDLPVMFTRSQLDEMGELMRARPKGRLSLVFTDSEDGFEEQMARALAIAFSERWSIVFNDHTGSVQLVQPGGIR